MLEYALGMIETKGLIAAIEAADAALKAAEVKLVSKEKVKGGIINIKIVGDVAAVRAAVDAGAAAAQRVGELMFTHVIPSPISDLEDLIYDLPGSFGKKSIEDTKSVDSGQKESDSELDESEESESEENQQISIDYSGLDAEDTNYIKELEKLNVHELRKLARDTEGLEIHGRQISMANKTRLLQEFLNIRLKK